MQARLEANLPGAADASASFGSGALPPQVVAGFSTAMGESLILPICVIAVGLVAVLFMKRPSVIRPHGAPRDAAPAQQAAQAAPAAAGE